jgi:hypothetical protein
MATSILASQAIQIPTGNTASRPSASGGALRYNTTVGAWENYSGTVGGSSWSGLGEKSLICRSITTTAWNTYDIQWGNDVRQFDRYEIHWAFADAATPSSRMFVQFFVNGGTLWNNSSTSGYNYCDTWAATNDGTDLCGFNASNHNSNCSSYIPITNHQPSDSGYWSGANGESQQCGWLQVNQLATSFNSNHLGFFGEYVHYSQSYGGICGNFGGQIMSLNSSWTAQGPSGGPMYGITGIRFGYLDGYTNRAANGGNAYTGIITIYGINGTEVENL